MAFFDAQRTSCANCEEDLVSGAEDDDRPSATFRFAAPFPNPVTDRTRFSFTLERAAHVALDIFDLRGRKVATLLRGWLEPNVHVQTWAGRDNQGQALASGHYLARLKVDGVIEVREVTLVR